MGRRTSTVRRPRPRNTGVTTQEPPGNSDPNVLAEFWGLKHDPGTGGPPRSLEGTAGLYGAPETIATLWNGGPNEGEDDLPEKIAEAKKAGLTVNEFTALYGYTWAGYEALNSPEYNRETWNSPEGRRFREAWKRELNNALDKLPDYKGTVIRNTRRSNTTAQEIFDRYEQARKSGNVITYDRFNSASTNGVYGRDLQIQYVIKSTKGKKIRSMARHRDEEEVLFKSDAQYLVTDVQVSKRATIDTKRFPAGTPLKVRIYMEQVD